ESGCLLGVFVYASADVETRKLQWSTLIRHSLRWGRIRFVEGDFNDILSNQDKRGGRLRDHNSFRDFQNFVNTIGMGETRISGHRFTWANNRQGENFIEALLDRVFLSPDWLIRYPNAFVNHITMSSSDHNMLTLQSDNTSEVKRSRFVFDPRWMKSDGYKEQVEKAWNLPVRGPALLKMQERIRNIRQALIKWKNTQEHNSAK
ncbi:Unknown protein, partial [Striga hermonthica]